MALSPTLNPLVLPIPAPPTCQPPGAPRAQATWGLQALLPPFPQTLSTTQCK